MREREVEKYLVGRIEKEFGWPVHKFVPDQAPGMPDRVVLLPGSRVLWVELKTKGGRLSELQKYRHAALRHAGHEVVVVWSKEQADDLIEELKKKKPG